MYFENLEDAKQYILNKKNYTYISYTPNTGNYGNRCEMHRLNFLKSNTAHQVIGQEFENVITVLDKNFYYDENERLWANKVTYNPYSLRKMFFQQITRAINKLEIVDNGEIILEPTYESNEISPTFIGRYVLKNNIVSDQM